ncbi:MAG: hypothetical protein DI538_09335 [Azospira oryzae]|nr:MAG: hypothetical protein DI538_09335 [Azospira oryzae]
MKAFSLKIKQYQNGLGLLIIGITAFFMISGNPLSDFQLMSRGITVRGITTDVNDFEDREDNGNVSRYFFIKYEFTTATGQKISDVVEVQGTSSNRGFQTGQALDIQYLSDAPNVHRIKALASTTLTGWIFKNILFGLLAIAPGLYFLYRSYQSEHKSRAKRAG